MADARRRFGIRQKVLLLLAGVLVLTTTLHTALAWYFTEKQNESQAFAALDQNLRYWESDLQGLTRTAKSTALEAVQDMLVSDELNDIVALDFKLRQVLPDSAEWDDVGHSLGYRKSVALSRMRVILRSARLSSIAVYINGTLSYYLSESEAGMRVARRGGRQRWVATGPDPAGNLQALNWPAWREAPEPITPQPQAADLAQPAISLDFSRPEVTALQIRVPLMGVIESFPRESRQLYAEKIVSAPHIATPATDRPGKASAGGSVKFAEVVFRQELDRSYLSQIASQTGKWPSLVSPDGRHVQHLQNFDSAAGKYPRSTGANPPPEAMRRIARVGSGLFYQEFLPWRLEGRPVLILGLASSMNSTSQNVRETATAILAAAGGILLVSIALGTFWIRRFTDPIVDLTAQVKDMGQRSRIGVESSPDSQTLLKELRPVAVKAPDEMADLSSAFNALIAELRRSLETLEQRIQERMARDAALAEAARIARLRSEFFAQMSHELRTPLNAILGYAQILLQEKQHLTERQAAGLATIRTSGEHLLTLINDILDLSRAEAAKLELLPEDVVLAPFLKDVTDIIRVKAAQKGLSFVFEPAADLPAVVGVDGKRLRQVLLNLLGNAVKFTDRGEVKLRVSTSGAEGAQARVHFEIEDSGIGMTSAEAEKLFRPFEQVSRRSHREGGAGLGLAISRHLVQLMGGDIRVRSVPNEGSVFSFDIAVAVGDQPTAPSSSVRPITGYYGPRKTILVVDHVCVNRLKIKHSLTALGFEVDEAEDGLRGLEQATRLTPDLILMKIMMPNMDGLEATRRIRERPELVHLPVIAVTASTSMEDEAQSLDAGANAFVTQPMDLDALLERIKDCLGLTWTYGDAPQPWTDADGALPVVVPPPAEEIEVLHELAQAGSMRDIRARAEHLRKRDPQYAAFATRLETLASRYQSQAILKLIEQYRRSRDIRSSSPC